MTAKKPSKPRSVDEKIKILMTVAKLRGEELTAFLTREELHLGEVEQWRLALDDEGRSSRAVTNRIRRLERELARKEKALAEAAALLVLKKTPGCVWGRGRRHGRGERQVILALLAEAEARGAGLQRGCGIVGASVRTIQRWRARPEGADRRCGPRRALPNALSAGERERALAVMRDPAYADLSPKQFVPRLADEGRYLASESTLYRLQHRYGLRGPQRVVRPRPSLARAASIGRPGQTRSGAGTSPGCRR